MTKTNRPEIIPSIFLTLPAAAFRGLGQIMLQENAVTGAIFLAGIFMESSTMGFAALLAAFVGTFTARLLSFDETNTEKGIYGFSAALVGVALMLFLRPLVGTWLLVLVGAACAAVLQHFFFLKKIPVFTLPFVLVTWLLVAAAVWFYPALRADAAIEALPAMQRYTFALSGFGQVIFQSSALCGGLFFIAVFIQSPVAALYGLAGSVFAAIFAAQLSAAPEVIYLGLYGYNAVLCAIVFAGRKVSDGVWASVAVLLACVLSFWMKKYALMELTFPFVAATVVTLLLKQLAAKIAGGKLKLS